MKNLSLALAAVLLLVAVSAMAAKKAGPKADEVIMATTDDGRRVVLMGDGTWKFVAGESRPPEPEQSVKGKVYADVVAYFSGWKIEQTDEKAGLVQTGWRKIYDIGLTENYLVKVSVIVSDDGKISPTISYRNCGADTGCFDVSIDQIKQLAGVPVLGTDAKKAVEFDTKLRADLGAIETKHKK